MTDPLEELGRRTAMALANRQPLRASTSQDLSAVLRRARRRRAERVAVYVIAAAVVVPFGGWLLRPEPHELRLGPTVEPVNEWIEVGQDVFGGPPGSAGSADAVVVADGRIVIVGADPNSASGQGARPAVWLSEDGRKWKTAKEVDDGSERWGGASVRMRGVTTIDLQGRPRLVAVGNVNFDANFEPRVEAVVWVSDDVGETWRIVADKGTQFDGAEESLLSVTGTDRGLVAVGMVARSANGSPSSPAAWISATGDTWAAADFPEMEADATDAYLVDVAESGGRLAALGRIRANDSTDPTLWVSETGSLWEPVTVPDRAGTSGSELELQGITAADDGGFLAAGYWASADTGSREGVVLRSKDGIGWHLAPDPAERLCGEAGGCGSMLPEPGSQAFHDVVQAEFGLLAVGASEVGATIWAAGAEGWAPVLADDSVPTGGTSVAFTVTRTPAGMLVTGTTLPVEGGFRARVWLRPDHANVEEPDVADPPPPGETHGAEQEVGEPPPTFPTLDTPLGTFGGAGQPLGPISQAGVSITAGGGESGDVTAVDQQTGAVRWTYNAGESSWLGPVHEDAVLIGTHRRVAAVGLSSGEQRWSLQLDNGESPGHPTIDGATVYLPTSFTFVADISPPRIYAIDVKTGQVTWQVTLQEGTELQWASPVVVGELVLVLDTPSHPGSSPSSWLHALDRGSGELVWRFDMGTDQPGFHYQAPVVADGRIFAISSAGQLFAVDLASGQELWRTGDGQVAQLIGVAGDTVTVSLNGGQQSLRVHDGTLSE